MSTVIWARQLMNSLEINMFVLYMYGLTIFLCMMYLE